MAEAQKINPQEVETLKRQNQALQQRVQQLSAMVQQTQNQPDEPKKKPFSEYPELDEMDNKELLDWLVNEVTDLVKGEVEPVREEVTNIKQETTNQRYEQQIREAAEKYPDFWQYANDMERIAQNVEGITAEQAYILAKNQAGEPVVSTQEDKSGTDSGEEDTTDDNSTDTNDTPDNSTQPDPKSMAKNMRTDTGEKPRSNNDGQQKERYTDKREAILEAMDRLGLNK